MGRGDHPRRAITKQWRALKTSLRGVEGRKVSPHATCDHHPAKKGQTPTWGRRALERRPITLRANIRDRGNKAILSHRPTRTTHCS